MAQGTNKLSDLCIRPMTVEDAPALCNMVNPEGWGVTLDEALFYRRRSPHTYLVAEDQQGELGFCCASVMGEEAMIDHYIVREDRRGQGIGSRLFSACLKAIGERRVTLFSELHNVPMYQRAGFHLWPHLHCKVFKGHINYCKLDQLVSEEEHRVDIQTYQEANLQHMAAFDAKICKVQRCSFLKCYFERPGLKTLVAIREGFVVGYISLCPSPEGYKIGPLYADSPVIAKLLWKTGVQGLERGVYLQAYAPVDNVDALSLFDETFDSGKTVLDIFRLNHGENLLQYPTNSIYSIFASIGVSV